MAKGYIRSLDGLRAVAILLVIGFHGRWLEVGWVGVQLFFVLSGFLISRILLAEKAQAAGLRSYLSRFYRRRALRIFPLYFFYVALLGLAHQAFSVAGFGEVWASLITYTYNWERLNPAAPYNKLFVHLWSLSVEEQFYLIWPFVVWFVSRRAFGWVCAALIVLGPLVRFATGELWLGMVDGRAVEAGLAVYCATTSHLDAFAWGAAAALLERRRPANTGTLCMVAACVALSLGGLNLLLADHTPSSLGFPSVSMRGALHAWGYSVLNAGAAAVVLHLATRGARVLENGVLCYLGRISYGVYVYHYAVWVGLYALLPAAAYTLSGALLLASCVALTTLIAALSFRFVEQPFLSRKDRAMVQAPRTTAPARPSVALPPATGVPPNPSVARTEAEDLATGSEK